MEAILKVSFKLLDLLLNYFPSTLLLSNRSCSSPSPYILPSILSSFFFVECSTALTVRHVNAKISNYEVEGGAPRLQIQKGVQR